MFILHSNHALNNNINFFSSSKVFKSTLFVLFTLAIFLVAMFAQSSGTIFQTNISSSNPLSVPIQPFSFPTTTRISSNTRLKTLQSIDLNHNLIADGLDSKLANEKNTNQVDIILILKENIPVPDKLISQFKKFGGKISNQWNSLGMLAGTMSVGNIKLFAKVNQFDNSPLGLIEEDGRMVKYSQSDRQTNLDPYVWGNYSLLGDKNNSIAIFDTGVDTSHPMLASYSQSPNFTNDSVKVVGWYDATPDNATKPEDYGGHGSHVAAIAAGNPYNDTTANGYLNTTYLASYNATKPVGYQAAFSTYLNITTPGTITQTYYWIRHGGSSSTYGSGLLLLDPSGYTVASDTIGTSINSSSGTFSISYPVTTNLGMYQLELAFYYQDPNSNLEMVSYGNEPFSAPLSVLHSHFSGVAPDTKIVGIKVFDNIGNGLAQYLINGITWAIANKQKYHISVASMSLGFPCNATGCTNKDRLVSVEIAVNNLVKAGIVTFVAAGNDGQYANNQIGSPANVDSVITVGATDNYHNVTYYSSEGPGIGSNVTKPDLTAPGGLNTQGAILSADSNNNDAENTMDGIIQDFQKNDMIAMQGTSMATPYAAGIGSLIIEAMGGYNNWNYTLNDVYKVKQIMLMSTWSTNHSYRAEKNIHEGWGEIQADAAIDVIKKPDYAIGSKVNFYLSNDVISNKIWGRKVSLTANTQYDFLLTMSSTLDADLYLYSNNYDSYGQPILLQVSKRNGLGLTENITFTPTSNGTYYLYVKTWSGKGTFTLSSNNHPTISGPKTIYLPIGTTGQISWTIFDLHPTNYTIFKDGTILASGNWTNFVPITVPLANLPKGTYNYTIIAFNQKNLAATNQVLVISYQKASITSSGNLSFLEGTKGKVITWSVTDDALANYTIYQNGLHKETKQITGTSATITYNLDGLSAGDYNFTLAVFDHYNLSVTNSVYVTVTAITQTTSSSSKTISSTFGFEGVAVLGVLAIIMVKRKIKK